MVKISRLITAAKSRPNRKGRIPQGRILLILLIASPGPVRAEDQAAPIQFGSQGKARQQESSSYSPGANFDREPEKGNAPGFISSATIDLASLGKGSWVSKLSFSPDGRYLAILDTLDSYKTELIIWDLTQSRIQTIINTPSGTLILIFYFSFFLCDRLYSIQISGPM